MAFLLLWFIFSLKTKIILEKKNKPVPSIFNIAWKWRCVSHVAKYEA